MRLKQCSCGKHQSTKNATFNGRQEGIEGADALLFTCAECHTTYALSSEKLKTRIAVSRLIASLVANTAYGFACAVTDKNGKLYNVEAASTMENLNVLLFTEYYSKSSAIFKFYDLNKMREAEFMKLRAA